MLVIDLLLQKLDALGVPVAHLQQGAVFLVNAIHIGPVPHRHHLLSEGHGLHCLIHIVQLWPDVGDEEGASVAAKAVLEEHGEGRVTLPRPHPSIHIVANSTQGSQDAVDADSLSPSQILVGISVRLYLLQALRACQVDEHELPPLHDRLTSSFALHHALNGQHEEAVRPRGEEVPVRLQELAALLSQVEHLAHFIRSANRDAAKVVADEGLGVQRVLLHLELLVVVCKEVDELLVGSIVRVDLQE
mmetsp:Transcript_102480/g.298932  ORF Transcript_102480/g.298932 Transcript_102480/m.298932 type:complete len:246 (+) Transcript_102480:1253-1990(+)